MRAVPVVVARIVVVVHEVPAVHVVDEAVMVVVDAVARYLPRVGPDVRRQIGMRVVDSRVDHRHQDGAVAGADIPRRLG